MTRFYPSFPNERYQKQVSFYGWFYIFNNSCLGLSSYLSIKILYINKSLYLSVLRTFGFLYVFVYSTVWIECAAFSLWKWLYFFYCVDISLTLRCDSTIASSSILIGFTKDKWHWRPFISPSTVFDDWSFQSSSIMSVILTLDLKRTNNRFN